jgi:predicted DNA-binding transcriptional regulator AlpA
MGDQWVVTASHNTDLPAEGHSRITDVIEWPFLLLGRPIVTNRGGFLLSLLRRRSTLKKTSNPTPKSETQLLATVASTLPVVPETEIPLRFIGRAEVEHRTDLTYPTIWKMMRAKKFPRARENGGKNSWIEAEINAWIRDRPITVLKGEEGPPRARGFANPIRQKVEA